MVARQAAGTYPPPPHWNYDDGVANRIYDIVTGSLKSPFRSVFLKTHKISYLQPKTTKIVFLTLNNLLVHFQKYQPKEYVCVYYFKVESELKHVEKYFLGFFL